MSDNKRYYYLKLKENFFDSDEMVLLESMPDGYIYSNILLKLYLRSLKHEGKLMFNDRIPFNSTMLATITRHSVGVVEKAVQIFRDLQLIDVLDNGAIYMSDIQSFIGKSSTEADRKREYRKKIEEAKRNLITGGQVSDKCPDKTTPELEIEIEKDIDIDKEEKKGKYSDEHLRLAKKLQSNLTEDFPKEMNKVDIEKWADTIRLMEERDKASIEAIEYVINWLPTNEFWFGNIRSAKKLREKFEKLKFEIKADKKNHKKQSQKLQYSNPSEYDDKTSKTSREH
ncbi:phage replisome organizer N-terminal domain-containing protein [Enterococcus hirae]|uniref:phage replisome organizer N-terminal domain-containing protein n=14 Tax=Enterococcus TaxID=1350 RepID=UPI003CE9A5F4